MGFFNLVSPCLYSFFTHFAHIITVFSTCIGFHFVFLAPANCSTNYISVSLINVVFFLNFVMFGLLTTVFPNVFCGNENVSAAVDIVSI